MLVLIVVATVLKNAEKRAALKLMEVVFLAVQLVESRMPLQGLILPNKVGKPVGIPKLPLL